MSEAQKFKMRKQNEATKEPAKQKTKPDAQKPTQKKTIQQKRLKATRQKQSPIHTSHNNQG